MAEIVIKIDDELLNRVKYFCEVYLEPNAHTMSYDLMRSVQNGTLLPKGHGRLIDADKLKKYKYYDSNRFENAVAVAQIDWANTIIEADTPKKRKGTPLEENDSGYDCENWIP